MSPLTEPTRLTLAKVSQPLDADAQAYVNAVEVADGQRIEDPVRFAINNFVIGCKADGIWTAIKASCILAGARTRQGALVPLVGTPPTPFGNVGGWVYNRKTGLTPNGVDNYLDTNRSNSADPRNSFHMAIYPTVGSNAGMGADGGALGASGVYGTVARSRTGALTTFAVASTFPSFIGHSRSNSSGYSIRNSGNSQSVNAPSEAPLNFDFFVFQNNVSNLPFPGAYATHPLAFYSIGEALPDGPVKTGLQMLDERVSALINAIGAAIP